jgi:glycerophosphoryl diester phosphodiesterase
MSSPFPRIESGGTYIVDGTPAAPQPIESWVRAQDLLTTATAPAPLLQDKVQPFNCTSGSITAAPLPALSGLPLRARFTAAKTDSSANTLTIPFSSGDATLDGSTSVQLTMPGTVELQVMTNPAGGKLWRVVNHVRSDAALAGNYRSFSGPYKTWADLPEPWVVPHRGAGALLAPQNTVQAFRQGVAYGLGVIDGGDFRTTTDGAIVSMHDRLLSTLTTYPSGNVDDISSIEFLAAGLDTTRWFGPGYGTLAPMSADEALAFGYQSLLTPEAKENSGGDTTYLAVVAKIVKAGLQNRVLFCSFNLSDCTYALAQGIPNVCLLTLGAQTAATVLASLSGTGVKYVAVEAATNADGVFTALVAGGVKVVAFTLTRQYDWAHYQSLGVIGCWADDPVRLAYASTPTKYRVTTAPWARTGMFSHGMMNETGNVDPTERGKMVGGTGAWRWQMSQSHDDDVLAGPLCPVANAAGTYTLTVPLVFDAIGSDTSRHGDVAFGFADDRGWRNNGESFGNGYLLLLRATGAMALFKVTNGSASQVGTTGVTSTAIQLPVLSSGLVSGTPITALPVTALASAVQTGHQFVLPTGQVATASGAASASATSIPITSLTPSAAVASGTALPQQTTLNIAVTSSGITCTRTDGTMATITASSEATFRGGYVHLGCQGRATGLLVSFGAVTVT